MQQIKVELAKTLKPKPVDEHKLGFGSIFTDHMFIMNYDTDQGGWHDPRIVPYGPLSLDPSAMCLHYGQETFEGMKAYKGPKGEVLLFRPTENFKRFNTSNDRLQIPAIDEELALEALKKLLEIEKDWIPTVEGSSLYIRPFIIATEPKLGVKAADNYLFLIILSPSGPYYSCAMDPVKIYVETEYVRAVKGGMGYTKTAGNYAASLKAQEVAHELGYGQVLWLDGVERKYIEEVGSMNVFFIIGDEIVTPMLSGSILPGITRKSVIEMLSSWGMKVSERKLSVEELIKAGEDGTLKEAFGTGTAAVISPIGQIKCGEHVFTVNDSKTGPVAQRLYDTLTGMQYGRLEDPYGWVVKVC